MGNRMATCALVEKHADGFSHFWRRNVTERAERVGLIRPVLLHRPGPMDPFKISLTSNRTDPKLIAATISEFVLPTGIGGAENTGTHYYRNVNLFWLGNPYCPDFPTENVRPGQKGGPFVPGLATGTKEDLLSRLVTPTGTKGLFFFMFFFSQFFFYFN